uniref:Growth factor receptor bound protein 7 n=1 Tax=Anser brachyrhynchus TaxID=132585 RepID=A0A8B9CJF0_9AVES
PTSTHGDAQHPSPPESPRRPPGIPLGTPYPRSSPTDGGPTERHGRGGLSPSLPHSRPPAEEEPRASSLPCIPNPFPELCSPSNSPILSSLPGGQGPPREGTCHLVKVFSEDGSCRSLEVSAGTTARQLCEMLVQRTHALHDHSWALVELHQHLALERCLEDHESVVEVQSAWPLGADSRFVFRKNFAKYELFKSNAQSLFPEVMVSSCLEANKSMAHSELIQVWGHRARMSCGDPTVPWGPNHAMGTQQCYGDPTVPWGLNHAVGTQQCYGGPNRYGMQLYRNYQQAQARLSQPPWIGPTRSVSDNALVAMDFSGCTGRVIENPSEVLTAALEEAQAWRKKTTHRYSLPAACQTSPLSAAIHRTQPWFHGRISREDTQQLIGRQGLVDGVFLVRESQRNPKGFVLSLCHLQKVKHYLILPSEEEGRLYFTMDDGQTRFADLIQLVEFHQINRGILPCKLRHYCTCVAL